MMCVCVCVCVFAHDRAIRPFYLDQSKIPTRIGLPKGVSIIYITRSTGQARHCVCMCACVCVCVCMCVCVFFTFTDWASSIPSKIRGF